MRALLLSALAGLLAFAHASAGRLDIAVIQFPEQKTPEQLDAALAHVRLFEISDSNRTMTKEDALKGGYVLFAQSVPAAPGSTFNTSTRIRDDRADVEGQLAAGSVSVTVTMRSGVKAGLRRFEKFVYTGSGSLPAGAPRVLSIRQVTGKSPNLVKGQGRVEVYNYTTAVIAQYTP